ncbi:MAG: Bifunctional phosphoglucose/phosphomannose isomerase [Microgenomates group bacterium GW2011_GWC1_37_8]|uniref:Bifunctional phosphoglucose/phosphomannose isomerase n=1 Tax=Candidatus Woesebacteria bacterium GW2011_GWB1_38_8 TaxID=1618570 RepID=A0A0G0NHC0_9BACT|nr:MAG: Bifunctional phosphoglucose/phosphomannose isomerase [Microgenomates group bacterium GW2011_GWC1_37_8]KKQ85284.1 MAG: Bifunctional phosphoglucose/phosphomannose isomerase [Candidatus Woesebacteria bacterium GW2011_GWB1_38_8]
MIKEKSPLEEKYKLIADSIRAYPLQFKQAWIEVNSLYIPDDYKEIDNVILCGMGGSALGARIIDSLIQDRLRIPFEIYTEYYVPNYVNEKSLVIASSYSGTTEETLNATYEALNRGAKVFGITTGGKLAEVLKENNIPGYIFNPINNPSNQPRMSLGYSIAAALAILTKLGFINVLEEEIDNAVSVMNETLTSYHENTRQDNNLAKIYSTKLIGKIPVIIASEHLTGTAHAIKNQLNENSKTFSLVFDIPEANHHLMEGLINPKKIRELLVFIFIKSSLYSKRVLKRYPITLDVVEKNGLECHVYSPYSQQKLSQVFETFIFGSMVAFNLAKEYKVNITEIPWVDYFKEKMKK